MADGDSERKQENYVCFRSGNWPIFTSASRHEFKQFQHLWPGQAIHLSS